MISFSLSHPIPFYPIIFPSTFFLKNKHFTSFSIRTPQRWLHQLHSCIPYPRDHNGRILSHELSCPTQFIWSLNVSNSNARSESFLYSTKIIRETMLLEYFHVSAWFGFLRKGNCHAVSFSQEGLLFSAHLPPCLLFGGVMFTFQRIRKHLGAKVALPLSGVE